MKRLMNIRNVFALALLLPVTAGQAFAAGQPSASESTFMFYAVAGLMIIVSLAILLVAFYVLQIIRLLVLNEQKAEATEAVARESFWQRINKQFINGDLAPVASTQEKSLLLDHNYDGIQELDNGMPPWLKYLFYGTIGFAAIYLVNFYVLGLVETSEQEYVAEMAQAEEQIAAYKSQLATSIDENTVQVVNDATALDAAKLIFDQNCKACHGGAGEGGVGPNLTDEYWLHGGDIKDVFKSIKYGIPQKGMIAWQQSLTPEQIQSVASFIITLKGTNPPNAKEPQGEKYVGTDTPQPSTAAKTVSMR